MRFSKALFASFVLAVALAVSAVSSAEDAALPTLLASIESSPRSLMSTQYGDLSDATAPRRDKHPTASVANMS